jgi:hypothetical protein
MRKNQKTNDGKFAWGAAAIGEEIERTAEQARYLFRIGAFGDAVRKIGHRTLVGDRSRLKQFPKLTTDDAA